MSKKRKITILMILVFLLGTVVVVGMEMAFAYYTSTVTGAFSAETSDFEGELDIVSATHSILPQANVEVDTVEFYVRNYTGSDSAPVMSEVSSTYTLSFAAPTWGNGCANPISYKLYRSGTTSEIPLNSSFNFDMASAQKHQYVLKLYWDMNNNSVSCYAGKNGNVGITVNITQKM